VNFEEFEEKEFEEKEFEASGFEWEPGIDKSKRKVKLFCDWVAQLSASWSSKSLEIETTSSSESRYLTATFVFGSNPNREIN